jgi:hypothetical protein
MSFPIGNRWMNNTNTNIKKTENTKKEKDIYTVVDFPNQNETFGRFTGSSPKRAANKAFTRLAKISKLNNTNRQFIVFTILNLTNDKEYKYIGTRIKLMKPRVVNRGGKKIVYKYINTVGKYKEVLDKIK